MNITKFLCKSFDEYDKGYVTIGDELIFKIMQLEKDKGAYVREAIEEKIEKET